MERPKYFSARLPPRNAPLETAIGRFMIIWGVLEGQLDSGVAALLGIDATLSMVVTSNLGTKAKIDLLHSAISISEEMLSKGLAERGHEVLNKIADMSGRYRNTVAHGSAVYFEDGWRWQRVSARTHLDAVVSPATAARWNKVSGDVRKITREWCHAYQGIWHALDAIPPKKRDAIYAYKARPG